MRVTLSFFSFKDFSKIEEMIRKYTKGSKKCKKIIVTHKLSS